MKVSNKFMPIVMLIVCVAVSVVGAVGASKEDHVAFIRGALSAWENNGYGALKKELGGPDRWVALPEKAAVDYLLFTTYDGRGKRLNQMKGQVSRLYAAGIYGDVARAVLDGHIEMTVFLNEETSKVKGNKKARSRTLDDLISSNVGGGEGDETEGGFALKSVKSVLFSTALEFFILRNDVLAIIKEVSDDFLNSDVDVFSEDRAGKLSRRIADISDKELVEHIMKRYLAGKVHKVERNGSSFVFVSLNSTYSYGSVYLVGSNDKWFIDEVYASNTFPNAGMTFTMIEEVAPGWVLLGRSVE